jgi:prepilin-type N-terminal cleavage/methylation domain-containing protein
LSGAAREDGFTLVELVTAMLILSLVIGGIGKLFVSGIQGQTDANSRFRAQGELGSAVDKLKRDLHSACTQTAAYASHVSTITILGPNPTCLDASGNASSQSITWCVRQVGTATRYQLFRVVGATCTGGTQYADYITTSAPFTYFPYNVSAATAPSQCSPNCYLLARLHVDLSVDLDPAGGPRAYALSTDIAFRNSRLV